MKICLAGQGAFGIKHLEAISKIDGIEVVTLTGGLITSVIGRVNVAGELAESVTLKVTGYDPTGEAIAALIMPVLVSRLTPTGKEPLTILHVKGEKPPVATRDWL